MKHTSRESTVSREPDTIGRSFLEQLIIDYGPLDFLGRFFAAATDHLSELGLELRIGRLEDAYHVHQANLESWKSYPPMLNPTIALVRETDCFSLICVNQAGTPVAVIAGRLYSPEATLADVISNQRFVFGDADPATSSIRFNSTTEKIASVKAPFSYIGALWVHPQMRGAKLARILPPIARSYCLAIWNIRFDLGLASLEMTRAGIAAVYGYTEVAESFCATGLDDDHDVEGCFMWMDRSALLEHAALTLTTHFSKVDRSVINRAADQ